MRRNITIILLLLSTSGFAQLGGGRTFQFLNTPHNAKVGSMGNVIVSTRDNDPGMVTYNPGLLNEEMHHQIQFNESFYAPGVKYSSINYATKNRKGKLMAIGINNLSFEKMNDMDETGVRAGDFFGNETVVYVTRASTINNFTIGVNAKYAQSILQRFMSISLLTDLGITYSHPEKDFNFGLVMRNIGWQVKSYSGMREPMPFQVNAGVTFKPEHMPLRIVVSLHDLQQFDIVYNDTTGSSGGIFQTTNKVTFGDKVLRHLSFGAELDFMKNLKFRIGYNFQRRKEMKLGKAGGAGFSWGFITRIRHFQIEYGKTYYQFAGRPAFISITTNLDRFFKTKSKDLTTKI